MMATYINGQGGSVIVGSTTLPVTSWSGSASAELLDVTTTGSNGWMERILGIKDFSGNLKVPFDTASVPFSSPLSLKPGTSVTLKLQIGTSGTMYYTIPALIEKADVENDAKAVVTLSVDFKSTGAITFPS
jgi:hypothetical protein